MRRTLCGALAASALLSLAPVAAAQTAPNAGFAANHFDPAERGSDWFVLDSLDLRGNGRFAIGVVADWAYRPLVLTYPNGDFRRSIIRNDVILHPGVSVVLWDRVRIGLDLPVQVFADGHTIAVGGTTYTAPASDQAIGDLRIGADLRLFGTYGDVVTGAIGLDVYAPTGDQSSYMSDGSTRLAPHAMLAGDIGPFVYAAKVGVMVRTAGNAYGTSPVGTNVYFGASAGLRLAAKRLVIGPEVFGNSVVTDSAFFDKQATPVEGMLGAHYLIADQVRIGAGISTGLTAGYGTPQRRGVFSLEWAPGVAPPDRDHDGILDRDDACPDVPGIRTEDPATNGCPAPPPPDAVVDVEDACPDDPGVRTDDPKTNGCPPDRDHDGVLDRDDACPDVAGLKTSDPKTNGCPDPDRDKDGIPNDADACPDEPGKADPDPKRNGCPKAFVRDGQIRILDQVKFKTGSAEILPGADSQDILLAVRAILQAHPEITKVRVEGHTDNRGAAAMNKKLSKDRAASVVKWLTKHDIAAARLDSVGYGLERPIDSNETEQGRKNNRRVEFHIETKDPAAAVPADAP